MARRADNPYTDDTRCPYPPEFAGYGEVNWFAQNEGQKIRDVGLHMVDSDPDANIDHKED